MASLSLKSFYPIEEESKLLERTEENATDYESLKVLTFKKLTKTETQADLEEIERLLSLHRGTAP